ncbi:MAG: hypothetical protein WC761_05530 [Candidatus Paceibacterota bacterium]
MKTLLLLGLFVLCSGHCSAAVDAKCVDGSSARNEASPDTYWVSPRLLESNRSMDQLWRSWGYIIIGEEEDESVDFSPFKKTSTPAPKEPVSFFV